MEDQKPILGLIEEVIICDSEGNERKILAKIDTGADSCSIDLDLASELSVGPIIKTKSVVSSHGRSLRPVVNMKIILAGMEVEDNFTIYNRSHMSYKILIGRNLLRKGFLIDPSKNEYKGVKK
ncbi:MAG: hypothetical protein ACI8Y7_000331 [Candidatus Woesearchaeota archaeon]|jgi:hypothetical protein